MFQGFGVYRVARRHLRALRHRRGPGGLGHGKGCLAHKKQQLPLGQGYLAHKKQKLPLGLGMHRVAGRHLRALRHGRGPGGLGHGHPPRGGERVAPHLPATREMLYKIAFCKAALVALQNRGGVVHHPATLDPHHQSRLWFRGWGLAFWVQGCRCGYRV